MKQLKNLGFPLLISLMLATQLALCVANFAKSSSIGKSETLCLAPIEIPRMTARTNITKENNQSIERKSHFIPGVTVYSSRLGRDEANRLAKDGVVIGTDSQNNYIDLVRGNILIHPEKAITTVCTHEGFVHAAAGSTVFITECDTDVVIYDLFQTKPKQVSIVVGANLLMMKPGQMLVLTRQATEDFEKLELNCHSVGYSNAQQLNMHSRFNLPTIFMADFSIASAIITIQPLKQLISSNNRQDRLVLEKLVKSSVILGDFTTVIDPDL